MTFPAHRFRNREERKTVQGSRAFAFDIDGVIDAFPREMGTMIAALTAAAHKVYIITGVTAPKVTQADIDAKRGFLNSLGVGPDTYAELIVCPEPHAENKLKAIEDHQVGVLIDNDKTNIKTAAGACVGLLLWNSKEA